MLSASEHLKRAEAADERAASVGDPEIAASFRALAAQWREMAQHAPECTTAELSSGAEAPEIATADAADDAAAPAEPRGPASLRRAGLDRLKRIDARLGGTWPRRLALLTALLLTPVAIVLLLTG